MTPERWVFGAAWSTIMLCFTFYMTQLSFYFNFGAKNIVRLYAIQWIFNVSWNYIFFNQHQTELGLVVIVLLWLLVGYFTFTFLSKMKYATGLILPYLIWMTIATSLNAYIVLYN